MAHSTSIAARAKPLENAAIGYRIAGVAAFALLTALGAFMRIPLPFTPVPITLQTFFVLTAGVYLGGRDAAASQLAYLLIGATGLPVFAGGAGIAHLLGPTGGYLLAFPLAAWFVGAHVRPGDRATRALAVLLIGMLAIFALGTAWLARVMDVDAERAIALGVLPFLPGEAIKLTAATLLVVRAPLTR
jgi:biotin transport system substrate-specific component